MLGVAAFVEVPVVLQAFVPPRPSGTCRLIAAGAPALPPLWPGSRTTTRVRVAGAVAGTVVVPGAGRADADPAMAAGAVTDGAALGPGGTGGRGSGGRRTARGEGERGRDDAGQEAGTAQRGGHAGKRATAGWPPVIPASLRCGVDQQDTR